MTDGRFDLSRRKILAGLGTVGVAGAGAGAGTTALFSDDETFEDNSIQAGELNLVVDYATSVDQDGVATGSVTRDDELDGNPASYQYTIADAKPGDSGLLAFCPKIVDNPGYLYVGSVDGITNYENGQTEPESGVDSTTGGSLGGSNDGAPNGELGAAIQADTYYADIGGGSGGPDLSAFDPGTAQLIKADQSLNGLFADLEAGFLVDGQPTGQADVYPSSPDADSQTGPCLVIDWEIPASVGNEIQSDAVEIAFTFAATQSRNNAQPGDDNPFAQVVVSQGSGGDFSSIQNAINSVTDTTVLVEPGTYQEDVRIPGGNTASNVEGLTLASTAGPGQTRIEGQAILGADDVLLTGFTVAPPPSDSNQSDEAIRVSNSPDGVTVRGNVVEGVRRTQNDSGSRGIDGINVFGGDSSDPVENVRIANNEVRDLQNAVSGGAAGISVQGNVRNATVRNNTVSQVGKGVTSYGFGVVVRGTGNHSQVPRNVSVVDNEISDVLADTATQLLGVGLEVEAGGPNLLFDGNTVQNVNIGVELKAAPTETTLVGNTIGPINTSVNDAQFPSVPALYLGDLTGSAPIGSIIDDNSFDVPVTAGGSVGSTYPQTILPQ